MLHDGLDEFAKGEFYMFIAEYEENINNLCIEKIDEMIENIKNNLQIENKNIGIVHINENLKENTDDTHPLNEIPENLKKLLSI